MRAEGCTGGGKDVRLQHRKAIKSPDFEGLWVWDVGCSPGPQQEPSSCSIRWQETFKQFSLEPKHYFKKKCQETSQVVDSWLIPKKKPIRVRPSMDIGILCASDEAEGKQLASGPSIDQLLITSRWTWFRYPDSCLLTGWGIKHKSTRSQRRLTECLRVEVNFKHLWRRRTARNLSERVKRNCGWEGNMFIG